MAAARHRPPRPAGRSGRARLPLLLTVLLVLVGVARSPGAAAQDEPAGDQGVVPDRSGDDDVPPDGDGEEPAMSWSVRPAGAETGGVSRPYLVHDVEAGSTFTDAVQIDNQGLLPVTLEVYAADGYNTANGSFDVVTADRPAEGVGLWVRPELSVVTVPAGSSVEVPVRISVPASATPGDYSGGVVASLVARTSSEDGRVVDIERRVGVRVHLRVDGSLEPGLVVEDLTMSYDGSTDPRDGTVVVEYSIRNTGNVRLGAEEHLDVVGPFDWTMSELDLEPVDDLLPGGVADREVRITGIAAMLNLDVQLTVVALDPTESVPGLPEPFEADSSVWAIPWSVLVAVAAVLAIGAAVVRRLRRPPMGEGPPPDDGPEPDDGRGEPLVGVAPSGDADGADPSR